jgi:tetratricopeptide (TPR) repeat protein
MKASLASVAFSLAASTAFAQSPAQTQFEAGQYEQALATLGPELANPAADPWNHFSPSRRTCVWSGAADAAPSVAALTASEHRTGGSWASRSRRSTTGTSAGAIERAERAVEVNPNHFAAQYELGLAKARAEDWAGAARAFERSVELNPNFAYAAYYTALSYSKVNRADKTAEYIRAVHADGAERPGAAGRDVDHAHAPRPVTSVPTTVRRGGSPKERR